MSSNYESFHSGEGASFSIIIEGGDSNSGNRNSIQNLTLYTLYENVLVENEVNAFNQNHSDFHVTVEVGLSGDSGLTENDAIKRKWTRYHDPRRDE